MALTYNEIAAVARASCELWDQACKLCESSKIDPQAARDMVASLGARAEQAKAAGLVRSARELREAAAALSKRIGPS